MPNDDKKTVDTPAGKIEVEVKSADPGGDKTPINMKAENQVGGDKKPEQAILVPGTQTVQKTILEGAKPGSAIASAATATGIAQSATVGDTTLTAESSADAAAKANETVKMNFPRKVILTVDHSRQIIFEPGLQEVPKEHADHPYLKNNGVTLYDPIAAFPGGFGGTQAGFAGVGSALSIDDMRKLVEDADKKKAEQENSPQGIFEKFMMETSGGYHAVDADWTTVGRDRSGFPVVKGSPADVTR